MCIQTTSSRNTTYSHKGCLQCKESHRKCDESKPSCLMCLKKDRVCQYQPKKLLKRKAHFATSFDSKSYLTLKNFRARRLQSKREPKNLQNQKTQLSKSESTLTDESKRYQVSASFFVPKIYLHLRNVLNEDVQMKTTNDIYVWRQAFDSLADKLLNWRKMSWENSFKIVASADPIWLQDNELYLQQLTPGEYKLNNKDFDDYILIVGKWYFSSACLFLFPDNEVEQFKTSLTYFVEKFPLVKTTVTLVVASYLTNIYESHDMKSSSIVWNTTVTVPLYKECVSLIRDLMKKGSNQTFEENVALGFCAKLLFPFNTRLFDSNWKTHLLALRELISDAHLKKKQLQNFTTDYKEANSMLKLIESWIFLMMMFRQMTSDRSSLKFSHSDFVQQDILLYKGDGIGVDENYDLLTGLSRDTFVVLKEIADKTWVFKNMELTLLGNNMIYYKLLKVKDSKLQEELSQWGDAVLEKLKEMSEKYDSEDIINYQSFCTSSKELNRDLLTHYVKMSDYMVRISLEAYVKFFSMTDNSENILEIMDLMYRAVDVFRSIKLNEVSVSCGLPGILSLMMIAVTLKNDSLIELLDELLKEMMQKGSALALNASHKFNHIKKCLAMGNIEALAQPSSP